jgi:hypothetical protein
MTLRAVARRSSVLRSCGRSVGAALVLIAGVLAVPAGAANVADNPAAAAPVYAPVGPGTHFIDENAKLAGYNDPQWYKANIPFLDIPDRQIEDVYYYRWRTWKEHLRYTDPTDGWISTEFLDCCGYAAPYQAINAAAGFHIAEGRWVRDQTYADDYIRFWLDGPGRQPQNVNPDAPDWAHEYSFWAATAVLQHAEATGDVAGVRALQGALVRQYRGWDNHFDAKLGLYWQLPVWDAKEYSPAAYESSSHFAGVHTFRPSINAYQYGDALAIAQVARLNGDAATAAEYEQRAAALRANAHKWLWDPTRHFWYDIVDENNPTHQRLDTREETGFVPWQFDLAEAGDSSAWKQILDPQGFAAPYGPTTVERRSHWFMSEARQGCCHWDGPSWPYSTAQELTGLANELDDYPPQQDITPADYLSLLHTFAVTQYRDGKPYVAEAHDPDQPNWIYDSYSHSEDYNHSSFDDLVISGLIGLRPSLGDRLSLKPLVPPSWDHFALENVPYHGHNVTVLYDRDGSHYHAGSGFAVYVDGKRVVQQALVGDVSVRIGRTIPVPSRHLVNDAANPLRIGYPRPIASYTSPFGGDDPWHPLDGKVWFNEVPESTRWTNYASPNAQDYYGVDFGAPTLVSDVRFYGYDDGGGVRPAAAYTLQYWTGIAWADVPGQQHTPEQPVGNGLNRITFAPLTTSRIRLLFTNPDGAYVGVSELQAWSTSSPDARVAIGPANANGVIPANGPTPVTVTVQNATDRMLHDLTVSPSVPEGWRVAATSPTRIDQLRPTATFAATFRVSPPQDVAGGTRPPFIATATYVEHPGGTVNTHARQDLFVPFPPGQHDPVATWTFDEGSGTVARDGTAGGHDLDLANDPEWVAGQAGSAVQYDGTDQYAQTAGPVVDTAGNFSVSAWVRLDSTGRFATAVSQDGSTTSGFYLQYSVADNRFAFATGEGRALSDNPPITGRWYHLVGVHDANAGTYTLYVDGARQATVWHQATGDLAPGRLAVGRAFSGGRNADFWPGTIDEVHVWNRALTAAEVAQLHAAGT